MSGIFGAYSVKNQPVLEEVYLGLYALQHRGQESAGIAWAHDGHAASARGFGLLHNAIDQHKLSLENAHCAIGHVATSRSKARRCTTSCPSVRTTRAAR